ncbi:hypothetical protein C8J56DRAFT_935335 [Mycena floridula]|nr:hypothetical protein C8J56DRAFT_935335 [Mycena floridula]
MNKNPFVPQPSYTPQQPPLPPGPPPPQPTQPDYSAYWAAAAAHQQHQQHLQPQPVANFGPQGPQWSTSQAPRPPPEQSALYANYGYGPQQSNWHRHQQQQQQQPQPPPQQFHPGPPPPAAQVPPGYNPYQAPAGYPQPFPQGGPYPTQHGQNPAMFSPHNMQMQQQQQQQQGRPIHHSPAQHLPPAKRPRFDGPTGPNMHRNPPTQPQFHPPNPAIGAFPGPRGGGPTGPTHNMRGGRPMMNAPVRGGRGGSMGMVTKPGMVGIGRGGSRGSIPFGPANPGIRGGPPGPLRGHGSNRGTFVNQNRRGGGSFNGGQPYPHQGQFRGRGGPVHLNARGRHDGLNGPTFGQRDMAGFGAGKREENRRTLTDFKIIGLEISELSWSWGVIPVLTAKEEEEKQPEIVEPSEDPTEPQPAEEEPVVKPVEAEPTTETPDPAPEPIVAETQLDEENLSTQPIPSESLPPSRIRIYFHTPVSADDSHPIPNSFASVVQSDSRKGKRKKLEEEDGDDEDERPPPPPPQMSDELSSLGGASVAPSVAESVGEDWLMAAIAGSEKTESDHEQPEPGDEEIGEQEEVTAVQGEVVSDSTVETNGNLDAGMAENAENTVGPEFPVETETETEGNDPIPAPDIVVEALDAPEIPASSIFPPKNDDTGVSSTVVGEPSADQGHDSQIPAGSPSSTQETQPNGLSSEPTLLNVEHPPENGSTPLSGDVSVETQPEDMEHLPEPPASSSSASVSGDISKSDAKEERIPSANRLSVSYAGGHRRLVIDAEVVESLRVFRAKGRIEIQIKMEGETADALKGILVEGVSDVTKSYTPLQIISGIAETDPTVPPFAQVSLPTSILLTAYLDMSRPLSEPRWVRTGDTAEWLRSMFGRMFWTAGDASEGWEKRISVEDPDPPPTIWTVLEGWAGNSPVGSPPDRQRFLKTHMSEIDNILEILLRLIRGERATPFLSAQAPPNVSGPLLSALAPGSPHGAQQTHVSLAVLAMFRMTVEYAIKAGGDQAKIEVETKIGEIIRCIPSHLIYKSLDGIFKEWRMEKKK